MVAGPLVVLGGLVAMCGRHVGQDGCQLFADYIPAMASVFFACPADAATLADFLADNWIFLLAFAAQASTFNGHSC